MLGRALPLVSLFATASMLAADATSPAEMRLPDMIVRPELLSQTGIDRETEPGRELLRLTTGTANVGLGPLEIRGGRILGTTQVEVAQRIYLSDGTWFDRPSGVFTYHPTHGHVHFDDWTIFRMREVLENDGVGGVVAQGSKVSFCLADFDVYDPTNDSFPPFAVYGSCGFEVQGISPGWGDTYAWWLPDQWIDITGLPDGVYWLEVEVDPDDRLAEADESNNVARVQIRLRPPLALPDSYEENDSFDEVAAREEGVSGSPNLGLIVSRRAIDALSLDDDRDVFLFRLDQPGEATGFVRIESPWSVGDLNLALFDSGRSHVAASEGLSNTEQVSLADVPAGTYYVQVTARSGTNPGYALTIDPTGNPCPLVPEGSPLDADGDRRADDCDNCPVVANTDQEDSNRDGSGDACQPSLSLGGVVQDGGEFLEVRATAIDPQGDPLTGAIVVSGASHHPIQLQDALEGRACDLAFLPDGAPGEGIGFTFGAVGEPYLFDIDSELQCRDGGVDYLLAAGPCEQGIAAFAGAIPLGGLSLPASVCIRRAGARSGGNSLTIETIDRTSMQGTFDFGVERLLEAPFEGALPRRLDLPSMSPGRMHELVITLTDGVTPPVTVRSSFLYSGERILLINTPPSASLATEPVVECDGHQGGLVDLDGAGSVDPDSSSGTHDDLVLFEWFEDFAAAGQKRLGSGERLSVILPLGTHNLVLRVTDSAGETDLSSAQVMVHDSVPPTLTTSVSTAVLWPPDHRMAPIAVSWEVLDLCDPFVGVELVSVTSSEPDDAAGLGDGATQNDIQQAEIGTPDTGLLLRAERKAGGSGRRYELTYATSDRAGNASTSITVVTVPASQGAISGPRP